MTTYSEYRQAAVWLWGTAGEFAADEFGRINREHFAGSVPPLPIVIGIMAYGHCVAITRGRAIPRISLASEVFNGSGRLRGGPLTAADALIHEMLHAFLMLRGENPDHNFPPWCRMITELTPALAGIEIRAEPVGVMRVPNPDRETDPKAPKTKVVRRSKPGCLSQADLGRWPQSVRPGGYYREQKPISADTY